MDIRNIAIIAHVDHGKTTLVDQLLRQSGAFREHQAVVERALDRNDLEKERGITILAKVASVEWKGTRINIVDTPGHADFGGEVERILNMVDGAIILVDAAEGVLPQTKFVLGKALAQGLKPIVVVNKVDRQDARPDEVHTEVFDLFAALGASDEQLDFQMLFASGRQGWADLELNGARKDLSPMFDLVLKQVPAPKLDPDAPVRHGRLHPGLRQLPRPRADRPGGAGHRAAEHAAQGAAFGRLRGRDGPADQADELPRPGARGGGRGGRRRHHRRGRADRRDGAGHGRLARPGEPLHATPIDPPTLAMTFRVNDGPLGGREGKKVTSRQIRDRLLRESEGNVAIKITESNESEAFEVAGRGELQLGVLIETMRREGFELTIGRPRVLTRQNPETGAREEPMEEVLVDVDEPFSGVVVEKMSRRKGVMQDMRPSGGGKVRLTFTSRRAA